MDDFELLNHAEMKLDEAVRSSNANEREYWRGYVTALRKIMFVSDELRTTDLRLYRSIIIAMADHSMNVNAVADTLHYSRNNICYHIEKITCKFGLNPRKFYELCQLMKLVKAGEIA